MQPGRELGERERLREVVVAARRRSPRGGRDASRAVRKSTGASMPRARSAWQRSRPSASGRPMSITSASARLRSSALRAARGPSASLGREAFLARGRARASVAQLGVVLDDDDARARSLLPQYRPEPAGAGRGAAHAPASERGPDGRGHEGAEVRPRHGEVVRRRVEDVPEHGHEHLGQEPAEPGGEEQRTGQDDRPLAPQEGADGASGAPRAAIVASSCRRSASASATNSATRAAARRTAKTSSMRLMPVRSTVGDRAAVCARLVADVGHGRRRRASPPRPGGRRATGSLGGFDEHDIRAAVMGHGWR